jgi:hypothetical protein
MTTDAAAGPDVTPNAPYPPYPAAAPYPAPAPYPPFPPYPPYPATVIYPPMSGGCRCCCGGSGAPAPQAGETTGSEAGTTDQSSSTSPLSGIFSSTNPLSGIIGAIGNPLTGNTGNVLNNLGNTLGLL